MRRILLLVILAGMSVNCALAQACPPGDPLCDEPDNPPTTPIDGGVSLLIGAAALYGAKKLRDRKNQPPID